LYLDEPSLSSYLSSTITQHPVTSFFSERFLFATNLRVASKLSESDKHAYTLVRKGAEESNVDAIVDQGNLEYSEVVLDSRLEEITAKKNSEES